ncbi:uncharacterized protein LOC134726600 [Mytilus trossulus]|uniref:uncharacterized protein LOC134726600 n=1 Tax=Mytilus trossulus TaxID=6551 RepID=UPI003007D77E
MIRNWIFIFIAGLFATQSAFGSAKPLFLNSCGELGKTVPNILENQPVGTVLFNISGINDKDAFRINKDNYGCINATKDKSGFGIVSVKKEIDYERVVSYFGVLEIVSEINE